MVAANGFSQIGRCGKRVGRRGSGQISAIGLSVPESSLDWWRSRLATHGFEVAGDERFGRKLIRFENPGHIVYEMVGIPDDDREPYTGAGVPREYGIRGTNGVTVSVRDFETSMEFMELAWNGRRTAEDGDHIRYEIGEGGPGRIVDYVREPDLPQGSWTFGEGIVHHCAFQVESHQVQDDVKAHLEGLGFTDVSERKDRGYFESMYVRTPSGALFEATVSKPEGFLIDEPYDEMGKDFQVPPVFADQAQWIKEYLEPLSY